MSSSSNLEEVLPLADVTPEAQGFSDSKGGNNTAFDAFTGLAGGLGCAAIFSTRLVEMSSEAIAFGQHGLQEEAQFSVLAMVSSNWLRSARLFTYREISRYCDKAQVEAP